MLLPADAAAGNILPRSFAMSRQKLPRSRHGRRLRLAAAPIRPNRRKGGCSAQIRDNDAADGRQEGAVIAYEQEGIVEDLLGKAQRADHARKDHGHAVVDNARRQVSAVGDQVGRVVGRPCGNCGVGDML